MQRLRVAFDEGKETVGGYILTAITPMVEIIVNKVIPAISGFADGIGTTLGPVFTTFFEAVKEVAIPIFEGLKDIFDKVKTSINENSQGYEGLIKLLKAVYDFTLKYLAPVFGTTLKLALQAIGTIVSSLISAFGKFLTVVTSVFNKIVAIVELIKNNPLIKGIGNLIGNVVGSSLPTPSVAPSRSGSATVNNITVNGAIDSEGTARAIVNALNQSMYRGTGGAGAFA
jgi:phage-related protein